MPPPTTNNNNMRDYLDEEEHRNRTNALHSPALTDSSWYTSERMSKGLPGIAWLMSYPNSGTTFTMQLVHHVSNLSIATNYAGIEYQHLSLEYLEPVPLSNDSPNGPFLKFSEKPLPSADSFILTKTHCCGYCFDCSPIDYIETKHSFKSKCARSIIVNNTNIVLQYDFNIAEKAIHLIRNPFDNIVSNFHLDWSRHKTRGNENKWLKKFSNNADGFKKWCHRLDRLYLSDEKRSSLLPSFITELFKGVPCHTLFYLFAEWHNLARQVLLDLHLPTLVIHYEEYEHNFGSTVSNIMEFLNLPRVEDPIPFISGKEYKDYFSFEERLAVKKLVQTISDDWTWNEISKYFPH